jgi:pyruvate ferredoxin oxidoreductase delta subunit
MASKKLKREGPYANSPANIKTGAWRQEKPMVNDSCVGCKICVGYCPAGVISVDNKKAVIDYTYCKGCGICPTVCPRGAILMIPEELGCSDDK